MREAPVRHARSRTGRRPRRRRTASASSLNAGGQPPSDLGWAATAAGASGRRPGRRRAGRNSCGPAGGADGGRAALSSANKDTCATPGDRRPRGGLLQTRGVAWRKSTPSGHGRASPSPAASLIGLSKRRQQLRSAVEFFQSEYVGVIDGGQVEPVRRKGRRAAACGRARTGNWAIQPTDLAALPDLLTARPRCCAPCDAGRRPGLQREHQERPAAHRYPAGTSDGAPDAWPGTARNGGWKNRARPARHSPRTRRCLASHVERLEATSPARGRPQRRAHPARAAAGGR